MLVSVMKSGMYTYLKIIVIFTNIFDNFTNFWYNLWSPYMQLHTFLIPIIVLDEVYEGFVMHAISRVFSMRINLFLGSIWEKNSSPMNF